MGNQEILTKAIQLAGGIDTGTPHFPHPLEDYEWNDEKRYWYLGDITIPLFEIIYQHSFAQALWPDETSWYATSAKLEGPYASGIREWQYHLQQMVIADDPIVYLGEHI